MPEQFLYKSSINHHYIIFNNILNQIKIKCIKILNKYKNYLENGSNPEVLEIEEEIKILDENIEKLKNKN